MTGARTRIQAKVLLLLLISEASLWLEISMIPHWFHELQ